MNKPVVVDASPSLGCESLAAAESSPWVSSEPLGMREKVADSGQSEGRDAPTSPSLGSESPARKFLEAIAWEVPPPFGSESLRIGDDPFCFPFCELLQ